MSTVSPNKSNRERPAGWLRICFILTFIAFAAVPLLPQTSDLDLWLKITIPAMALIVAVPVHYVLWILPPEKPLPAWVHFFG